MTSSARSALLARLRDFGRAQNGMAAVEFAMILPFMLAMYLGGASFGSVITGNLSDRMARAAATAAGSSVITESAKAIGLQQAMFIIPVMAIALALVLYAGSRTIEGDMRKV